MPKRPPIPSRTRVVAKAAAAPTPPTGNSQSDSDTAKLIELVKGGQYEQARAWVNADKKSEMWLTQSRFAMIAAAEGNNALAEHHLRQATREEGCSWKTYKNLAQFHVGRGEYKQGLELSRKAYELNPEDYEVCRILSNCLIDLVKFEEVLELTEKYLAKDPTNRHFLLAKAAAYKGLGLPIDSLHAVEEVFKHYPDDLVAQRLQADIIAETDSRAGLVLYKQAFEAQEKTRKGGVEVPLKWNMCLHLLRTRDFPTGWDYWELGFHRDVGTMGRRIPPQLLKLTRADQKEVDPNKWTLLCPEQGIGDQILFFSGMNEFLDEFKKVIVPIEPRMQPMMKRSFPNAVFCLPGVIESWQDLPVPNNGYVPLGSVLSRYRQSVADFERGKKAFLQVNGDLYRRYHEELRKVAKGRPVVGISWRGGFWDAQKRAKAMEIEDWSPIFERGALCVNLQYGDCSKEEAWLESKGFQFVTFPKLDFKKDLDDWLAIAAACDGILSVSTALVHFAGACGQRVGVIMPEPQGPWILGVDDEWHLAYPEVHIFRRTTGESVKQLIDRVSGAILS